MESGGVDLGELARAGLLVVPDFLDAQLCAAIRLAMIDAASVKATIVRGDRARVLDERTRRVREAAVPAELRLAVNERLSGLRPRLEDQFGTPLGEHESPHFLAYTKGDFFRPHQDNSPDPTVVEFIRRRRVSVVVFLGRQARLPEADSYCGGELVLFRLPHLDGAAALRASVWGRPGMLVAFDSAQLHEVAPVTHGFRGSVVTWYGGSGDPS